MEIKEGNHASRAELIRLARENCSNSLGGRKKNYTYTNTDTDDNQLKDEIGYAKSETGTIHMTKVQGFFVRLICAIIIFFTVYLMNQYEIGNKTINKNVIKEVIMSSEQAHKLEDMATEWVNEKIIPVFHLPKK